MDVKFGPSLARTEIEGVQEVLQYFNLRDVD
jgi:hypothetical protein